jgi:hypothetical protein
MKTVSVGGTSKVFSSGITLREAIPLFFDSFDSELFTLTNIPNGEFLVTFNHNAKLYRRFLSFGGQPDRAVLIRLEPESVFPAQYGSRVTGKYGLVISPGSSRKPPENFLRIGWPYQYHLNPAHPESSDPSLVEILGADNRQVIFNIENWSKRNHLLSMVAANKVSAIPAANYSLRRKLARSLPPNVLEVYGPLWKGSLFSKVQHRLAVLYATLKQGSFPNIREIYGNLFQTYGTAKGIIENKHTLLQDSKFSLVVENSNSIVTENIFDAIKNAAIPIYIGPDMSEVGLPSDISIPVADSAGDILKIIQSMDSSSVGRYLSSMYAFLESELFWTNWEAGAVYRRLATEIVGYMNGFIK